MSFRVTETLADFQTLHFTHQLTLNVLTLLIDVSFERIAVVDQFLSTVLRKSVAFLMYRDALVLQGDALTLYRDALVLQGDALTLYRDALVLQGDALTLYRDALALQGDALTLYRDALALQGIAKFNLLRINEMLY